MRKGVGLRMLLKNGKACLLLCATLDHERGDMAQIWLSREDIDTFSNSGLRDWRCHKCFVYLTSHRTENHPPRQLQWSHLCKRWRGDGEIISSAQVTHTANGRAVKMKWVHIHRALKSMTATIIITASISLPSPPASIHQPLLFLILIPIIVYNRNNYSSLFTDHLLCSYGRQWGFILSSLSPFSYSSTGLR